MEQEADDAGSILAPCSFASVTSASGNGVPDGDHVGVGDVVVDSVAEGNPTSIGDEEPEADDANRKIVLEAFVCAASAWETPATV